MSTKPNLPAAKGAVYKGELAGDGQSEKFAKPFEEVDSGILGGIGHTHDDLGEKSGFEANTDAYITKKGMAYGEAAKLNMMPPGMDISDQPYSDIRNMPLKSYTGGESFPDDGWPSPKDLDDNPSPKGSLA
jgi:hypothetical protein